MTSIQSIIADHLEAAETLYDLEERVHTVAEKLIRAVEKGNKILTMGNGGSAADSQHFAAEIVGKFEEDRPGYPCIALTTDTSILTSVSNDLGYEQLFARQVEALAEEGDVIFGISTSGNSTNVIQGIQQGNSKSCYTVGLLGKGGGKLKKMVDQALIPDVQNTARIQECHILILHIICQMFDQHFKSK